ncbi:MAG TPA: PQQ-binding-like beta-propeller repeat protein [Gaiellaceae bacterium]|nr:PQQ-binding-like beta-propeller repeat protein [Gaiellaceae bacterium]
MTMFRIVHLQEGVAMRRLGQFSVIGTVIALFLLTTVAASASHSRLAVSIPAFTPLQSSAPSGGNWISEDGNVQAWRYSALTQINKTNGGSLTQAWSQTFPAPASPEAQGSGNANPIAYNGILYQEDKWGRVFAVDGASGKILWSFDPKVPLNAVISGFDYRAIGMGDGMVFTADLGTVYALDATTGQQVWATQVADPNGGGGIDAAPIYYNGAVYDGTTGGDVGGPCIAFSLDAKTGKINWYYNNIPSNASQPGWNTWPTHRAFYGGGAVWDPPAISPTTGLVYFGVGNPVPYVGWARGPGKELNTESVLAINMKTGKFAWDFQEVHHDIWDYDGMQTPVVMTVKQNGQNVPVVVHINKDAYSYPLNAATGKPIVSVVETPVPQEAAMNTYPTQPIPATQTPGSPNELVPHVPPDPGAWTGIAPDGKPYVVATSPFTPYSDTSFTVVAPTYTGGIEWPENSWSPSTGLEYICANESDFGMEAYAPQDVHMVQGNFAGFLAIKTSYSPTGVNIGRLIALDPATNTIKWSVNTPGNNCSSRVISTASGIVLIARATGAIQAYDDTTGALLWSFTNADTSSIPRFIPYAVGGKEYIVSYTSSAVHGEQLNAYKLP